MCLSGKVLEIPVVQCLDVSESSVEHISGLNWSNIQLEIMYLATFFSREC